MTTWFGNTNGSGGVSALVGLGWAVGQAFAAPASGNITQARSNMQANGANATNVKILIYAVSGSAPAALLGQSDELTIPASSAMAIRTFTFSTPVAVVSGTSYFLMHFYGAASGAGAAPQMNPVGTSHYRHGLSYPTAPNPFAEIGSIGGYQSYLEAGIEPAAVTPVADFTGTPLTGPYTLSVAFTDTSTGTPTNWAWTFGDGGTSTAQNPSHNYTAAGTYTVALVATNAAGSNTKTRTGYVTVSTPVTAPVADFTGTPTSGDTPLTVVFTDLSA